VVITTQSPDQLRAELRLGLGLATGLVVAAVIAFGHAMALGLV
jgi:class 3 adenylate cyclase